MRASASLCVSVVNLTSTIVRVDLRSCVTSRHVTSLRPSGGTILDVNRRHLFKGMGGAVTAAAVIGTFVQIAPAHAATVREFNDPAALSIAGGHLWVVDDAGNSVTEINPVNGTWLVSFNRSEGYDFNRPDAIANAGVNLFVANAGGSVTEMTSSNGSLVQVISGAAFRFVDPVAVASSGSIVLILNAGRLSGSGSITEIDAQTGTLLRVIAAPTFAFADPPARAVSGRDVYVADERSNSVTEVNSATGALVRVVTRHGLDQPDGIAVESGRVWVANRASNSATDIIAATGAVVSTFTDAEGSYGFGQPGAVIGVRGNVYVASPFGISPMVTKISATSAKPAWYMCNTNGPYYFTRLSSFAVSGNDLWVASRSGANSETSGAKTGSLTELLIT
jgi:outer membrane protein assembly factor BamB